ncbi:hypothetical protein MUK42_25474, partial [Musa troglodytarum]
VAPSTKLAIASCAPWSTGTRREGPETRVPRPPRPEPGDASPPAERAGTSSPCPRPHRRHRRLCPPHLGSLFPECPTAAETAQAGTAKGSERKQRRSPATQGRPSSWRRAVAFPGPASGAGSGASCLPSRSCRLLVLGS